ncbi:MAG: YceI family protein [Balneolaceae bacterium]
MSDTTTITNWGIDPSHSVVGFKVKHLVISTVTGKFHEFKGSIKSGSDDFDGAEIYFEADVNSIDTGEKDRDAHLKSDDFFNAKEHPKLTFESNSFEKTGEGKFRLTGDLTIRGNTREVTLNATHGGTVEDPYGNTKAGFEITGTVNRKEFGLEWDAVTEAGNVVVGKNIELQLDIQLIRET